MTTTAPVTTPTPTPTRTRSPFVVHGSVLSAGAASWGTGILVFGLNPEGIGNAITYGGAFVFQIGLLCLLRVLWRTRALGDGRIARGFLRAETVLVALAMCSTLADTFAVSDLSSPARALLDATWPFSMMGMFGIGIRIAVAGRWKGLARFWPILAESWAVVTIPALGILGPTGGAVVGGLHLLAGYTVLGQIVARKQLTR